MFATITTLLWRFMPARLTYIESAIFTLLNDRAVPLLTVVALGRRRNILAKFGMLVSCMITGGVVLRFAH